MCHGWPVLCCCCDLLQSRQSLTKLALAKESKHERGTGADLTKLMQVQFVVVGFWLFFSPILISSEFILICKNPGISGTLALFCLFLFLSVWIYWTPKLLTWGWCSRPGMAHAQLVHDLSMQFGHLQLFSRYSSDFLIPLLIYWGFAILTCKCFAPTVCPTPKSWIYVTTLYFPKNTFNIPRFIWLRSKQLPQASWLHPHQAYECVCEWGLVHEKLWCCLSRILTLSLVCLK